jgi:signal transduction histidine kinase
MGSAMLAESLSGENGQLANDVVLFADRLTREIELQRCLAHSTIKSFSCRPTPLSVEKLFEELQRSSRHHPAQSGRIVQFAPPQPDHVLSTDLTILHRILYNMVINALEASEPGGLVKIAAHRDATRETFSVWNAGCIPPAVALRVFQRNFSTKGALGRGLGTYAMKLLGEKLLGGRVSFTSSPEDGTCFKLELPV